MGNAVIWYYPTSRSPLQKIDLGGPLSDMQPEPEATGAASRSLAGRYYRESFGTPYRVRIVLENFCTASVARDLYSLDAALRNGALCSVAEDEAKAWCGFAPPAPAGRTQIVTTGSPWYSSTAAVAATDEVWIQSGVPESNREMQTVSAVSGNRITLTAGLRARYEQGIAIRHRGFWPAMRLHPSAMGRPIITHDHRISYTLDLLLIEDDEAMFASAAAGGALLQDSTKPGGRTIDARIERYRDKTEASPLTTLMRRKR